MADTFTTTTSSSWFSRLGNALAGILFGIILFLGSFVLLTWNEGRAIHRAQTLTAGAKQVVSLTSDEPSPENAGKLVHLTGTAVAEENVTDPVFGIEAEALKLRRSVEMYQWTETEKSETKQKLGGGEETTKTYTYSKDWSPSLIDSSKFAKPDGHQNPESLPIESETFVAEGIHVGGFDLPESLVESIANFEDRPVTKDEAQRASEEQNEDILATPQGFYVGADPAAPKIGDLRISFQIAPSGPVSIIAGQVNKTFQPFAIGKLGTIELLKTGTFSADEMFRQEQEGNAMLTWILRLVGFLMMFFGLVLITNIASVAASVIPFLGNLVGSLTGIVCFGVALALSLATIAVAWLAYRPLIGIPLVVAAVACIFFAGKFFLSARKKKLAAA